LRLHAAAFPVGVKIKFGSFAFLLKITLCQDGENKPEKFDTDNGGFIMIHTDKP
jgi:hypothetical protein